MVWLIQVNMLMTWSRFCLETQSDKFVAWSCEVQGAKLELKVASLPTQDLDTLVERKAG